MLAGATHQKSSLDLQLLPGQPRASALAQKASHCEVPTALTTGSTEATPPELMQIDAHFWSAGPPTSTAPIAEPLHRHHHLSPSGPEPPPPAFAPPAPSCVASESEPEHAATKFAAQKTSNKSRWFM